MHNSNFKVFACVRAKETNLNLGWGSIQEWGCILANTVVVFKGKRRILKKRGDFMP